MHTPDDFLGVWEFVRQENFDAYLREVGVGMFLRKIATTISSTVTFTINGDHWLMVIDSSFKRITLEFDLGVEFDEVTGDGRHMKVN